MYKLNRRLTTCVKRVILTVSSIVVIVGFGRDSETRQRVILGFRSIFFLTLFRRGLCGLSHCQKDRLRMV